MRRVLLVLVVAIVVVWAAAMGDLRSAGPAPDGPEPAADEAAVEEPFVEHPQVEPVRKTLEAREEEHATEAPRPHTEGEGPDDSETHTRALAVARQEEVLRRIKAAAEGVEPEEPEDDTDPVERGEAFTSPDFRDAVRRYADEPRHVVWAPKMERNVRQLLEDAGYGERIEILNCRKSTCRLQLRVDEALDLEGLLAVEGLQEQTDLSSSTPMSLRAGVLTVHFGDPEGGP